MKPIVIYSLKVWVTFAFLAALLTTTYEAYQNTDQFIVDDLLQHLIEFLIGSIPFSLYGFSITWIMIRMKKPVALIKVVLCITEMSLAFLLFCVIIMGVDYHNDGIGIMILRYGPRYLYPLLIGIPLSIYPHTINAKPLSR